MVDIICIKLLKAFQSLRNGICKWFFIIIHILDHIDSISTSFKTDFHKTMSYNPHRNEKYAFIMQLHVFPEILQFAQAQKCSNLELLV